MGCHTWCYKKIDSPKEALAAKMKQVILTELDQQIPKMLDDTTNTPEHIESLYTVKELLEIYLYNLEEDELTDEEFYDMYTRLTEDVVHWVPGRGLFISTNEMPHDIFRTRNYPEDCLFSLEETRQWMREHECEVHEWTDAELSAFWKNFPDGMIAFG